MRLQILFLFVLSMFIDHSAELPKGPLQPLEGPGGAVYAHDSLLYSDYASEAHGYWLFEPAAPSPVSAPVIVFNHGYGAYNPMVYGGWIRHLVRKGNIVVFPRYQKNLIQPGPDKFTPNAARAIKDALAELELPGHVHPEPGSLVIVGHSYGGTISANLGVNFAAYDLPKPSGLFLCAPGTGPFRAGRLDDYAGIPSDTRLLVITNTEDNTVGQDFQRHIVETAVHTEYRNLFYQYPDDYGTPGIRASHHECYSLDERLDNGFRTPSVMRSYRVGQADALDYFGYWKLLDLFLDCARNNSNCDQLFQPEPAQLELGVWSDGTPIKPLEPLLK